MQFEIRRKPLGRNLTLEVDSGLRLDSSIHDTISSGHVVLSEAVDLTLAPSLALVTCMLH
jgi:hypothetical protein